MKELKLKVASRLLVVSLLNEAGKNGGSLSQLKDMMKVIEKVELTEDERTTLDLKLDESGSKITWKPEADFEKAIELNDDQAKILSEILKKKNEDKSFTFDTLMPLAEVAEQLGVS